MEEAPALTAVAAFDGHAGGASPVDITQSTFIVESEGIMKSVPTGRGSSVDLERITNKPVIPVALRGRRRSSVQAEVNIEEPTPDTVLEPMQEKIEEYPATHRVTRHQKAMMEKLMEVQRVKVFHRGPQPPVGNTDPMKLMDNATFSGEFSTEDGHLRQLSPASIVDTQSPRFELKRIHVDRLAKYWGHNPLQWKLPAEIFARDEQN